MAKRSFFESFWRERLVAYVGYEATTERFHNLYVRVFTDLNFRLASVPKFLDPMY